MVHAAVSVLDAQQPSESRLATCRVAYQRDWIDPHPQLTKVPAPHPAFQKASLKQEAFAERSKLLRVALTFCVSDDLLLQHPRKII